MSANPPIDGEMTHGEASGGAPGWPPAMSNAALPSTSEGKQSVLWLKDEWGEDATTRQNSTLGPPILPVKFLR